IYGSKKNRAFDYEVIRELLDKLYFSIDKIEIERNVENEVLVVNSQDAVKILQLQRDFIHNLFNYYDFFNEDKKIKSLEKSNMIDGFINYMPTKKLSSGENALLNLFSRLYDFLNSKLTGGTQQLNQTKNYILLLDEADLGFHPVWKKKFVNSVIKTIPHFFNILESKPTIQILFTTHDPLTLSDLPNKNIVYLYKNSESSETRILDYEDVLRPNKSFAANITDLLADSFYIEDGLIGDFAKEKLKEVIEWLDNKDDIQNAEKYKSFIKIIDEPIVQRKLAEMYDSKMEDTIQISVIEKQIKDLENLKRQIQK
ncbi:MAG: AAA family ATPase, partial [Flavobacterium sp.]